MTSPSPTSDLEQLLAESSRIEVGPQGVPESVLEAAESRLGRPFSSSYRWFLGRYGIAFVGGYELNGVAPPAYEDGANPLEFYGEIVSQHLRNRDDPSWDTELIEIISFEGEQVFCFDTSHGLVDGEYPIVELDVPAGTVEGFARDFFEFLRRMLDAD